MSVKKSECYPLGEPGEWESGDDWRFLKSQNLWRPNDYTTDWKQI